MDARILRDMPELSPAQREALGALLNAAPFAGVVRDLVRRFAEGGHELYLVGGTVRDALLDRASPDVDLTTDATPDQILAVVQKLEGDNGARWDDILSEAQADGTDDEAIEEALRHVGLI